MSSTKEIRFTEVDLLRFLAASSVLLFHYSFRGSIRDNFCVFSLPQLSGIFKYGHFGVDLFFLISGFVILRTALDKSAKEFLIARIVRLYPAYWFCCTLTFVVILIGGAGHLSANFYQWLINLSMIQGLFKVTAIDASYWTLLLEIKFYSFVFLLIWLNQIDRIKDFLGLWTVFALAYCLFHTPFLKYLLIVDNSGKDYSPYFIAGALFYLVHKQGNCLYKTILITISYAVMLQNTFMQLPWINDYFHTKFEVIPVTCIISAFYILFILIASDLTKALRLEFWVAIGSLTYPLYLLHQNIGYVIFNKIHGTMNVWLEFSLVTGFMLILAYLVHTQIERRFAPKLKSFLSRMD